MGKEYSDYLDDEKFRALAEEYWDYLDAKPDSYGKYLPYNRLMRKVAMTLKYEFASHNDWIENLRKAKVPYPSKSNGTCTPYPKTRNVQDRAKRKNLKRIDRGRGTSIDDAVEENTYFPQLGMGMRDALKLYLKGKTNTFLSYLVEEEEENESE